MKKRIDWERAAKDYAPVWLWVYQSDKYKVATNLYHWNAHSAPAFNHKFKYAELIRPEDVKKYTAYDMKKSDFKEVTKEHINFCKILINQQTCMFMACGSCCPFKQFGGECWKLFAKSSPEAAQQFLDLFEKDFEDKKPEYRPCESFEEFRPFMGKVVRRKLGYEELMITESCKYEWINLFKNYELLEPIDGSNVIGVKVD